VAIPGTARLPDDSLARWRQIRLELNGHRHELARLADGLYPDVPRVGTTPLLCRPEWIPDHPIPLDAVTLAWTEQPPLPAVDGTGPESAHVRPAKPDGHRYPAYADALAALDPPAVFENRTAYRILAANLATEHGHGHLEMTGGMYFDGVNISEAVGHELAAAWRDDPYKVTARHLPLRASIGDPCDLARRPAGTAITTLTIRRGTDSPASFLLHWRDPAKVTHAGGLYQVIPVGIFQPADSNQASLRTDLSLWRSMAREFSEELLDTKEDYRDLGCPIEYDRWPFYRELSAARDSGKLSVYCLGLGTDPLTLAVDILTVAVFNSETFDSLFSGLVAANAEGRIIGRAGSTNAPGIPFADDAIGRFVNGAEPMQAAGAAALQLGWLHRKILLA